MATVPSAAANNKIIGSGEMAGRIRSFSWERHPLGPIKDWPAELTTMVNMVLASPMPAAVDWGSEMWMLYNDGYREILGLRHPASLGAPAHEVWVEAWPQVGPQFEAVLLKGESTLEEDVKIPLLRSGRLEDRYWMLSLMPIRDGHQVLGVYNSCLETTNAVEARHKLQQSEAESKRILWSIGDAVVVTDKDANVVRMNPVAEKLTGWKQAEAVGHPLANAFRIVKEETREIVPSPADEVLRTGNVAGLANHTILIGKDGQETHIDDSAAPIRSDEGDLTGVVLVFRDVSERRELERERALALTREQQSNERLRFMVQATGQGTWTYDSSTKLFHMDVYMQELLGMSGASGPIEYWLPLIHPDDREPHEEAWTKMLAGKAPFDRECHMLVEGREFWLRTRAKVISSPGGDFIVSGLAEDVTQAREERLEKEASAANQDFLLALSDAQRGAADARTILQITSEKLGAHLNVARVGFSEASADLKSMHFVTGWNRDDMEPLSGSVPFDHWGEAPSVDFLRGRTVVYRDVREQKHLASQLGNYEKIRTVSVLAAPFLRRGVWRGSLYLNDPEPRHWTPTEVILVEEVARRTAEAVERAQAEEEVRSVAGRLGMAQEAGQMAAWQWDFGTDKLLWDGGAGWTYGRPPSEMTTTAEIFSYIFEEDREKVKLALVPAIEGTGEYRSEFRIRWPDGSTHWILAFGRTVRAYDGKPSGIVGININVTDQKQAEAALMQTEKLAAVGRLASTMAHEINNPLEAVTNLLYLARTAGDIEEAKPYLETADAELRRAATIVNQALRFHKQATKPTLSTFEQLTHELFKGRHSRLRNAGAVVEERDRTSTPVLCFEGEIRQVLNNLVSNAIDALSARGGKLILRGRDGRDWKTGRAGLTITVADTGSGMSLNTQKKLFNAFFTTKGIGGTGLGLWVSKEIIERHAGLFLLRSSEREGHRGTVFTIFLPYEAAVRQVVEQ